MISIFSTTSAGRGEDDERLSSDNGGFTDSDFGSSNQGAPGQQQGQPWAGPGGGPAEGMARAIYHRPRGANQAFVLQEDPLHHHHQQFHNQLQPVQQQQQPIASRGPPHHQHQRLPQEGRTPEAYSRARMVATQMQHSHQGQQPQGFHPNQSPQVYPQVRK